MVEPMTGQPAPAPAAEAPAANDRYLEAMRRFTSDLRMIQQVWQSMVDREVPLERHHWELLLKAHLDGRDLATARSIIDQMRAAGLEPAPEVRWQLAIASGRAGRSAEAIAQLDALREEGAHPPDALLPTVFSVELAAGRLQVARAHLRQMAQRKLAARPDEYQVLLTDVLSRRAIKDARALLLAMVAGGHAPSASDIDRVAEMMARAGHPDRAEALLDELHEAGVAVPGDARTHIAMGWARKGDIDHTAAALDAATAAGGTPSSHHRNALLAAVIGAGDVQAAWRTAMTLGEAIPSGANLDALCELSLKKGKVQLGLGAYDWMGMLGVPPSPARVADLVGALLKSGDLATATSVFFDAAAHGVTPDRRRARDLVDAYVKADKLDLARRLLDRLRKDNVLTNGRHYGALLAGLVRNKRTDDAVELLGTMLKEGVAPTAADASCTVAELVRQKRYDGAWTLIETLAGSKITVDEPTYRELMWKFAEKGNLESTKLVFDAMVAAGITPDDRHTKALSWASGETQRRLPDEPTTEGEAAAPAAAPEAAAPAPAPAPEVAAPAPDAALTPEAEPPTSETTTSETPTSETPPSGA